MAVRHVTAEINRFDREVAALEAQLQKISDDVATAKDGLHREQAAISRDYNDRLPDSSELPTKRDRDPLGKLIVAGAKKSAADREYQADHRDTIEPLASKVKELERVRDATQATLNELLESRLIRIFEALPVEHARLFTTDADGQVEITLPSDSSSVVWGRASRVIGPGVTEHYRWILRVPEDLDADGSLSFSNDTLLSARSTALWGDKTNVHR